MVKIAEAGPEYLAQGGGREGVEDMVGESGGIVSGAPSGLTPGLDWHRGSPAGTAVRDVSLGCLGVNAGLGVVAEHEIGLGQMQVQLGGLEAEAAGLVAVWVGRHLVLGCSHDLLGFTAAASPNALGGQSEISPGQVVRLTDGRFARPSDVDFADKSFDPGSVTWMVLG